ncbi:hypothetical protein CRG98_005932 [Punica granatum]|uniref:Uncharacterized protein n=1 Tax=Punica granatum TaxID=22663 RepID=A0A2I0KZ01_PUNGR|nr:hypothetical protein CRG98_005932 [Punica granatum]
MKMMSRRWQTSFIKVHDIVQPDEDASLLPHPEGRDAAKRKKNGKGHNQLVNDYFARSWCTLSNSSEDFEWDGLYSFPLSRASQIMIHISSRGPMRYATKAFPYCRSAQLPCILWSMELELTHLMSISGWPRVLQPNPWKRFIFDVVMVFGGKYLQRLNAADVQCQLQAREASNVLGIMANIDCTHWPWRHRPKTGHGMYRSGFHGDPSLILEAMEGPNLWIWHVVFGGARFNNDINVLDRSSYDDLLQGRAPEANFTINGNYYSM